MAYSSAKDDIVSSCKSLLSSSIDLLKLSSAFVYAVHCVNVDGTEGYDDIIIVHTENNEAICQSIDDQDLVDTIKMTNVNFTVALLMFFFPLPEQTFFK